MMQALDPEEAQHGLELVPWFVGGGSSLLLVGTYLYLHDGLLSGMGYAVVALIAVLMLLAGVWLRITIPGLVADDEA